MTNNEILAKALEELDNIGSMVGRDEDLVPRRVLQAQACEVIMFSQKIGLGAEEYEVLSAKFDEYFCPKNNKNSVDK